jgi:putative dehydrogenase
MSTQPEQSMKVGVIGLGSMGLGVARSLLRAGFEVHAFDVRREVVEAFRRIKIYPGVDLPRPARKTE